MRRNDPISKIMSSDVQTVHLGQKLSEVRQLLADGTIHHVPVVDGKKLVGILSATDMLRIGAQAYAADPRQVDAMLDHMFSVKEVMTDKLDTLSTGDTVREAAGRLATGSYHSLPVVDGQGHLAGLVTSTDLINYLLAQY